MPKASIHLELIFINGVREGPTIITLLMINLNPTLVLLFPPVIKTPHLSYFKLPYMQEPIFGIYIYILCSTDLLIFTYINTILF